MKLRRPVKTREAYGTHVHRHGDRTAHVQQDGETIRLLSVQATLADHDGSASLRGVAYGDLVGVLHRLDLPPADDATTDKLIAAQLDLLIPGQADHVSWGWQRTDDGRPTPVYTVSRRRLETLAGATSPEDAPGLITTSALALHHLFDHSTAKDKRLHLTVIGWDAHQAHIVRYRDGQLVGLDTLMLDDTPSAIESDALVAAVQTHLDQAEAEEVAWSDSAFTLLGPEAMGSEDVAAFEKVFSGAYERAEDLLNLPGLDRVTFETSVAVGAAIAALRPQQAINLAAKEDGQSGRSSGQPTRGRWVVAVAALLAALALLYAGDLKRAERITQAVDDAELDAKTLMSLNTDLQVARYLETTGPSFLAILDEFSHQTKHFTIDEMRYERSGQFTVRATGRSSDQINQRAAKLAGMKTLSSVRIRSQVIKDRDRIDYTLVAVPSTNYFAPFAPPPREAEQDNDEGSAQADSESSQSGGGA
ncbi:MAG: hypothetical protein AAF911_00760 [Planctomycetota bacterium]